MGGRPRAAVTDHPWRDSNGYTAGGAVLTTTVTDHPWRDSNAIGHQATAELLTSPITPGGIATGVRGSARSGIGSPITPGGIATP